MHIWILVEFQREVGAFTWEITHQWMCLELAPANWKGRTLYLHDVLYAPKVHRNLVFVVVLVKLGFKIVFEQDCVKVLLDNIVYGYGFLPDRFIVLDTIPINKTTYVFVIETPSNSSYVNDVKWHAKLGHIGQDRLKR